MVDPNRKINHLSDDDAAFLRECEEEFRDRFSKNDAEFIEIFMKETRSPPIVDPWYGGRRPNQHHNNSGPSGSGTNHWRDNNRGNYNAQHQNYNRPNNFNQSRPQYGNNRRRHENSRDFDRDRPPKRQRYGDQ